MLFALREKHSALSFASPPLTLPSGPISDFNFLQQSVKVRFFFFSSSCLSFPFLSTRLTSFVIKRLLFDQWGHALFISLQSLWKLSCLFLPIIISPTQCFAQNRHLWKEGKKEGGREGRKNWGNKRERKQAQCYNISMINAEQLALWRKTQTLDCSLPISMV